MLEARSLLQEAMVLLKEVDNKSVTPTAKQVIWAWAKEIEQMYANNYTVESIVQLAEVPCNPSSFTSLWFDATGTKISDIQKRSRFETNLLLKGFSEKEVKKIMEAGSGTDK